MENINNQYVKLSTLAKKLNVTKRTLYNWYYNNKLSFTKIGNLNYVSIDQYNDLLHIDIHKNDKTIIYCRVSSSQNIKNLESQAERVKQYCIANGYNIHKIVKECASGLNDNRPKLINILKKEDYTRLVVEHKDRLTRTGFNYIQLLIESQNKELVVINNSEDNKQEIIDDFVSIITSYCARIYGNRRSKFKKDSIIKVITDD